MELEDLSIKVLSMGMQITDQTSEIDRLNEKYALTLQDKVRLYPDLEDASKDLEKLHTDSFLKELDSIK